MKYAPLTALLFFCSLAFPVLAEDTPATPPAQGQFDEECQKLSIEAANHLEAESAKQGESLSAEEKQSAQAELLAECIKNNEAVYEQLMKGEMPTIPGADPAAVPEIAPEEAVPSDILKPEAAVPAVPEVAPAVGVDAGVDAAIGIKAAQ